MPLKALLTSLAILALPGFALAQEPPGQCDHETTATCAEGTQPDAETGACVPIVSS